MTQPESELGKEIERLKAEIASLKSELHKARQWVSVNERLPEDERRILVSDSEYGTLTACYLRKSGRWINPAVSCLKVTHWQELPEPPQL